MTISLATPTSSPFILLPSGIKESQAIWIKFNVHHLSRLYLTARIFPRKSYMRVFNKSPALRDCRSGIRSGCGTYRFDDSREGWNSRKVDKNLLVP